MFQVETVGKVGFPCGDVIFVPILAEAMKRLSIPPRVFSKAPPQEKYRTSNGSRRWIKKPLSALFGAKNCADREILDVWKRGDMRSTRNGQCIFIYQISVDFTALCRSFIGWKCTNYLSGFYKFRRLNMLNYIILTFELGGDEDAYFEGARHIDVGNQMLMFCWWWNLLKI